MNNILLIHGFNGIPTVFYYFKEELEKLNYNVIMPQFPVREEITVEGYFNILDKYKKYFNEELIVVAHSIGNPMFIKYISKYRLKVEKYISLAGFSKDFYNEGKDVLNEKVKLTILTDDEKNTAKELIKEKYFIYSDSDHLVPFELLKQYCDDINSVAIQMKDIGHMGKKSGLEKLPKVIELITDKKDSKDAILFDLDGTLWEVVDETYKSVNEVAKKHKLTKIDLNTIYSVFGLNRIESAKLYFPYLDIEKSMELMEEISAVSIRNIKEHGGNVYSNLEKVLKQLISKYQLFIVSNTGHREYIEAFLTTSGLTKYFSDYIAASELNISKADGINKIIKDYNIERAIYIGDTKKDMEASKIANIPFIQAKYGFGKDLKTEYYINSIEELPQVIELIIGENIVK